MNERRSIADWMRERREALGLTQSEVLARMAEHGVVIADPSWVSKIEAGQRFRKGMPSADALRALTAALETTVTDFMTYLGYLSADEVDTNVDYQDDEAVFTHMRQTAQQSDLPPEVKREIMDTIEWARKRSRRGTP